ncbi:galactose oxidase [Gigaspora margarita]|uniref:Galactose oxidase n=1 Tax=Gigaspora margarita TaxID=4874 RepID=A0A8H3XFR8_GIGMA|nr:galactose oxidase [Gigaspora margarita]
MHPISPYGCNPDTYIAAPSFLNKGYTQIRVVCQFVPDPRYAQTSTLLNSKIYFFGGGNTKESKFMDEMVYLDLASLNSSKPLWVKNPIGIPSAEILATSCISPIDKSTIFLIGGQALDKTKQNIINATLVYTFNSITSQWTTINAAGFYNYSISLVRMQAIMNNDGKIYIFGGNEVDYTVGNNNYGPSINKMNVLDTKTLTWSSLNITNNFPTPRVSYTATLLNNGLIIYIGGFEMKTYGYANVDMNEQINGDTIASRNAHSAVLTNDGHIIIFGGNSANSTSRTTTLRAQPDVAVLNTNISPYRWSIPNISSTNSPQSLCFHSAEIYNNIMIIAFGIVTSDQLQTTATLNKNIYLFDVQNYAWISLTTPTSTKSTSTNNHSNYMIIGISVGVSGFIIILGLIGVVYKYKKLRKTIIEMPGTDYYPIVTTK